MSVVEEVVVGERGSVGRVHGEERRKRRKGKRGFKRCLNKGDERGKQKHENASGSKGDGAEQGGGRTQTGAKQYAVPIVVL